MHLAQCALSGNRTSEAIWTSLESLNVDPRGVEPDRAALYAACDTRVSVMMANGALEEVRDLMARDLPHGLPIMKAVGVRELSAYLRGETGLDDALDIMRQATRNYAKRQLTWFRNQTPDWRRVAPSDSAMLVG